MGLFSKKPPIPTMTSAPTPGNAQTTYPPAHGTTVNLRKGGAVNLAKTPVISLTCSWPDRTDYDVFALVEYANGRVEHVAMFDAEGVASSSASSDRAVQHLGDVQRGSGAMATETIEVALNDAIVAVVPVVYSAQSNGQGSFREYQVSMDVVAGEQRVHVDSTQASSNHDVYSCVPAILHYRNGQVRVENIEAYSQPGSENRPTLRGGMIYMDNGARNVYK